MRLEEAGARATGQRCEGVKHSGVAHLGLEVGWMGDTGETSEMGRIERPGVDRRKGKGACALRLCI